MTKTINKRDNNMNAMIPYVENIHIVRCKQIMNVFFMFRSLLKSAYLSLTMADDRNEIRLHTRAQNVYMSYNISHYSNLNIGLNRQRKKKMRKKNIRKAKEQTQTKTISIE